MSYTFGVTKQVVLDQLRRKYVALGKCALLVIWLFNISATTVSAQNLSTPSSSSPVNSSTGIQPIDPCRDDDPVMCEIQNSDVGSSPSSLQPSSSVGNPINLMTGNKFQRESDFSLIGSQLMFNRMYNSSRANANLGLGMGWRHTYSVTLVDIGDGSHEIEQSNGARLKFHPGGLDQDGNQLLHGLQNSTGYILQKDNKHFWFLPDGRTLTFLGSFLVQIDWPDQRFLKLYYRLKRLESVTDETGRVIVFSYTARSQSGLDAFQESRFGDIQSHLAKVTLPDGSALEYDYDSKFNLSRIGFPDGTSRIYHYEDDVYFNHLTGITNRLGVRLSTWSFDEYGRAVSSENSGGLKRVLLQHPHPNEYENGEIVSTLVTNSLGEQSTYYWQQKSVHSYPQLLSSFGPGCTTCPQTGVEYQYDEFGRLVGSHSNDKGNAIGQFRTTYQYDSQNRITKISRLDSSSQEILVELREYRNESLMPWKISRPSVSPQNVRSVEITRDSDGLITELSEIGYKPWMDVSTPLVEGSVDNMSIEYQQIKRVTRYVYSDNRLVEIDGPNNDIEDKTLLQWDASNRLVGVKPPLQPWLTFTEHDSLGRPTVINLGTTPQYKLAYAEHGGVARITHRGDSVNFKFDQEGQLTEWSDVNGKTSQITYDSAGQMTKLADSYGRVWESEFDSEGRQHQKTVTGFDGSVLSDLSIVFDIHGRISRRVDKIYTPQANEVVRQTHYEYGLDGRLSSLKDAETESRLSIETTVSNTLEKLMRLTYPDGRESQYFYDALGNDAGIKDSRGNLTKHLRDDFGQVVGIVSRDTGYERIERDDGGKVVARDREDSGRTTYIRDAAGRIVQRLDSKGRVTRWSYEESNGKLVKVEDDTSIERYTYNDDGMMVSHSREIDQMEFETQFTYDNRGRMVEKLLPDGQELIYSYYTQGSDAGALKEISRKAYWGLSTDVLLTEIDQDPLDGNTGHVSFGNVRTFKSYSPNGVLTEMGIGHKLHFDYRYDAFGNLVGINENGIQQSYHYNKGRLTSAQTKVGTFNYSYDAVGNRVRSTAVELNGKVDQKEFSYSLNGSGNRLLGLSSDIDSFTKLLNYSAGGMPVAVGEFAYEYDTERRLTKVSKYGRVLASYSYNAFGERVKKEIFDADGNSTSTYFLYEDKLLAAEVTESGDMFSQYVYLDKHQPVIYLNGTDIFAVHNDHLGAPRIMSDSSGVDVWSASYTPFGDTRLLSGNISLPLRLPGQYSDLETGLYYNYMRYYNPETGRYLSADPIGLEGGLNIYSYVNANPLMSIDPFGLDAIVIAFPDYRPALPSNWPLGLGGTRPIEAGHGGVLIFDETTGLTRYYEFGRYGNLEGGGVTGAVRNYPVPNLVLVDGIPTQESLNEVFAEISARSGGGTRIEAAHVTGTDFTAMDEFGADRVAENDDPDRDPYSFLGNNCGHFTYDVLRAGGLTDLPTIINPTPANFVDELVEENYEFLTWGP